MIDLWELERVLGAATMMWELIGTSPENFGITPSQYMD